MTDEDLTVAFDPPSAYRRSVACEAVIVTDPETGIEERYEVAEFARNADPELLREKGREWFMEDHDDD